MPIRHDAVTRERTITDTWITPMSCCCMNKAKFEKWIKKSFEIVFCIRATEKVPA